MTDMKDPPPEEENDPDELHHCQSCGHVDKEIEFVPSDGRPVDLICPACLSVDVFPFRDKK